ncbi:unnamed protein product [Camellia sinensis]
MSMADSSHDRASFSNQANALLRKNLTFQKRNIRANLRLVFFPFYFCLILVLVQTLVNKELDKPKNKCGCTCIDTNGDGKCERVCGIEYSTLDQVSSCSIPSPPEWPPLLQIPAPEFRAVRTDFLSFTDLPDESCRSSGSCPATILFTGNNQSLGQSLGSETMTGYFNFLDPAFFSNYPLYRLQQQCSTNSTTSVTIQITSISAPAEIRCAQGLHLWRNNSSEINDELYKGFWKGNSERKIDEMVAGGLLKYSLLPCYMLSYETRSDLTCEFFVAAYDFLNSNLNNFNVSIWYNSTYKNDTGNGPLALMRVPRSVNLVSNAYLQFLLGPATNILFDFVKEMPKPETQLRLDFASLLGPLVFTWVIIQLFPVILTSLVYEKQQKLRIMMKMHGLGDGPYWMISYAYFLRGWIVVMELYPGFSLYRGLYEFSQHSFMGNYMGTKGMRWGDISDSNHGMRDILIIMFVEWLVVLFVAFYIDQVVSSGSGVGRSPLFFLEKFRKKPLSSSSMRKPSLRRQGSKVFVQMEKPDVAQETERVERLLLEPTASHAIICDNLKKVYPKRDGNPEKYAVRGLSLALPQGECFGMIGLLKPSSGTAYVEGLDIQTQMDEIYTSMGVCPQHNLLWENLTGREHLLFYGRLKNLRGSALTQAVEESLKSVNLLHGGVADKQAGKYSGGMKRRLSVAISLIGDPKVVYMDEPSTGLDPASRKSLWDVVKQAKQNRAIILTTHSMEEAEHLCDRLGIFVDGSLQCIGNPKELKARYGGSYVFTMTTTSNHEEEVENLVQHLSPNANKIYHLSGTQKFELPKQEVRIADVFQAVENAKSRFTVHAWGLADTTLEDVFIKVARGAQAFNVLS